MRLAISLWCNICTSLLQTSDLKLMIVRMAVLYMKQRIIGPANGSIFIIKKMGGSYKQPAKRHNNSFAPAFNVYMPNNYKQETTEQ